MTQTLIKDAPSGTRACLSFSAGKGECRSPSTGFTGLRGTTAVLDPTEEGPAFRAIYLDGRRYLGVFRATKLSCGAREKRVPGRLTCGFLRLGVGTI